MLKHLSAGTLQFSLLALMKPASIMSTALWTDFMMTEPVWLHNKTTSDSE